MGGGRLREVVAHGGLNVFFITRENKIQFSFYYVDKSIARHFSPTVCINNREKARKDVINTLTSEDMENMPLESRI